MPVPFLRCLRCGRRVRHAHGDGLHCRICVQVLAELAARQGDHGGDAA
jgi:hypothetical protein